MKKSFLAICAALTALASCTQSELENKVDPKQPVEIKLNSTAVSIDPASRSPFEGSIGAPNSLTAMVIATPSVSKNYASAYVSGNMTFTDQTTKVSFNSGYTGNNYYPSDDSELTLAGLYPATGWTMNTSNAFYTITGCEDLMLAKEVTSKKSLDLAGTTPRLEFKHLLTKLDITFKAEDATAATAWGKVNKVEIVNVEGTSRPATDITAVFATGNATLGNLVTPFACFTMSESAGTKTYTNTRYDAQAYDLTTTGAYQAYSMIAPLNLASGRGTADITFRIYAQGAPQQGGVKYIDVPVSLRNTANAQFTGSTAGKYFTISMLFKAKSIQAIATVTDWQNGGSANPEIQ